MQNQDMKHTRGAPYHPMTQGKIERYHRSMKNVIKLEHYYFPWELEQTIEDFVTYYNNERYHESLKNVTPAEVYFGTANRKLKQRKMTKIKTLKARKNQFLKIMQPSNLKMVFVTDSDQNLIIKDQVLTQKILK